MDTKTKSSRMDSLVLIYDRNTEKFLYAIKGINDYGINELNAHKGFTDKTDSLWDIMLKLLMNRYENASMLGSELKLSSLGLYDIKEIWEGISEVLRAALVNVSDEKLDDFYIKNEEIEMTYLDYYAKSYIYYEVYRIGQLFLTRDLVLGLKPEYIP